jgi:hypothetical protein
MYVCVSPLLLQSSVPAARQWLGKQVPLSVNTCTTIVHLLNVSFSVQSVSYQKKVGDTSSQNVIRVVLMVTA